MNDNPSVIGMIASVLVSFTVTALFSVSLPRFHILSQVDAAAVTDEVSLIAVPAKIPNASPCIVSNPIAFPSIGKKMAASTLKKKITAMDCAISSSSAPMTGAVAAIAEPPQIEDVYKRQEFPVWQQDYRFLRVLFLPDLFLPDLFLQSE